MEQLALSFQRETISYTAAELALLTPEDIYECTDAELLQRLKEDRRLERKPAGMHGGELGQYFSMWANTTPGGLMVLGQEDNGAFSGCLKLSQQGINEQEKAGSFHCPEARFRTRRVPVHIPSGTDDFVLLVYVPYDEKRVVKDVRGRGYVRLADTKKELTDAEIRELEVAKGQLDLEQEPVSLSYPEDFNVQLVRQYIDSVVKIKGLAHAHADTEILAHGRLGKIQKGAFVPNVACALLFAKDPLVLFPGCKVRLLRFDGEVEQTGKNYNVIKDLSFEGPIPEIIVETAKQLGLQLRDFSRLDNDGRFYTAPEYPEPAWYEALVNACVHRSYILKNMVNFVKMFDDKLVIESPGGFPPNVTPETIYNTHSPRNPHLMNALFFMAYVKCHNEGTRRMRDSMDESNLPKPEFAQQEVASGYNSVRVTLRNNIKLRKLWVDAAATRVLPPEAWKGLGQAELRILNYVAEHGSINVTQTQKHFSTSGTRWHSLKKVLERMVVHGLLEHHHSSIVTRDSRACYKLPSKPSERQSRRGETST